jgi:hypothetical protein
MCMSVWGGLGVVVLNWEKFLRFHKTVWNLSTQEAEAGGPWVWDQPGLHNKFQASLGYKERPCLENKSKQGQITGWGEGGVPIAF